MFIINKERIKDLNSLSLSQITSIYFMSCYLYYKRNLNVISDDTFNLICKTLLNNFNKIKHPHKHLLDKESLKASTGYNLTYPKIVKVAAFLWYEENRKYIN